jgi:hypothetical protein
MATSVYLSSPVITIDSVSLTDQCTSCTVNYLYEQLETTSFGDTARKFGGAAVTSLQNNSIEVELFQSYASSETEDTIFGLVGIHHRYYCCPGIGVSVSNKPDLHADGLLS